MNTKPKQTEPSKNQRDSVLILIVKLASAMNVEISGATQAIYYHHLKTERIDILNRAIDALIETWTQPHVMPPVATVLEYVRQAKEYVPAISNTQRILERGDKPPDWEPLEDGELERMRAEVKERVAVAAQKLAMPK